MTANEVLVMACLLAATSLGVADVSAAARKAAPGAPLTADGQELVAHHAGMLKGLQVDIGTALPDVNEQDE